MLLWKDYASSFPIVSVAEGDSSRAHYLKPVNLRLNGDSIHYQTLEKKKSVQMEMLAGDGMGLLLGFSLEFK